MSVSATGRLLALRTVAELYGSLGVVVDDAGITRESLYRSIAEGTSPLNYARHLRC